ncbi:MAG: type II toxin-antitoxin system HigB family toxin [Candidatus Competibacteraceae bacterium]
MRIVALSTLKDFWEKHPDAERPLKAWYAVTSRAQWKSPGDVKQNYPAASILENNRVVFNIKGNTYRLIVAFHYDKGRSFIRFVGTHADYNRIDARAI